MGVEGASWRERDGSSREAPGTCDWWRSLRSYCPGYSWWEKFKGDVLDFSIYKNCHPWSGKKGIVVGAGTGAHDAAQDMLNAGLSTVTMI
jgi:hypothetical protein